MPGWVADTFAIPTAAIESDSFADDPNDRQMRWSGSGITYSANSQGELITQITVRFRKAAPRAKSLIDCLGIPRDYRATDFDTGQWHELYIDVWYPESGVVAPFYLPPPRSQPHPSPLTERLELSSITHTRWTTPEAMAKGCPTDRAEQTR